MIISLYGISRCGKDYTITKLVEHFDGKLKHIRGSDTLNKLSLSKYNLNFKSLTEYEQESIRKEFVNYVRDMEIKCENIIVDGHFSFPKEDSFKIVFTEEDLKLYDAFFYLNKSSKFIMENCMKNDKKQFEEYLSNTENIDKWKQFEINEMRDILDKNKKDFIVLDDSLNNSIDFIYDYVKLDLRTEKIADRIMFAIDEKIQKYKYIFLLDLDKTISYDDLTKDFIFNSEIDALLPKKIFKGDYYTTYQFYRFHKSLTESINYDDSIKYAVSKIKFNNDLINELKTNKDFLLIGITTGMRDAWDTINKELKLFDILIGKGKYENELNHFVTPKLKAIICKKLKQKNKIVYAIGDSFIDFEMLKEADYGFLINMYKLDKRIISLIDEVLKYDIYQLNYSNYKYEKIKGVDTIWLKHYV